MREAASKILISALLGLVVPCADASHVKASAHKPVLATHAPAHARQTKLVSVSRKRGGSAKVESARRHSAHIENKAVAERKTPAPVIRALPAPPAQEPAEDSVQVRHDRKQHFAAEPDSPDTQPRKATPSDFMSDPEAKPARVSPELTTAAVSPVEKPLAGRLALPVIDPVSYNKRGRLIVPPAMKGSHEILVHQNEMADRDGLDRVQDDADLDRMRDGRMLVPIPAATGLQLDERLPANRRFCRPWTAQFLAVLARAHYARFHTAMQVNSAVRTVEVQERLLRTNGNAAPAEGATASPHLTGQAVDLAKHGLSLTEIAWLRGYLLPLVQSGKVDVEEEFQQACFHISVYRSYVPQAAPKREIAEKRSAAGAALAAAIR